MIEDRQGQIGEDDEESQEWEIEKRQDNEDENETSEWEEEKEDT